MSTNEKIGYLAGLVLAVILAVAIFPTEPAVARLIGSMALGIILTALGWWTGYCADGGPES